MAHTSTIDSSFHSLLPVLQSAQQPTLWLADENALSALHSLENTGQTLHIVTNRYDIYLLAEKKKFSCQFNDFDLSALPIQPELIVYRVSKEKVLTHFLLRCAGQLLSQGNSDGKLMLSGKKQEGIKGYSDKLIKELGAVGKLKKNGNDYLGHFSFSVAPIKTNEPKSTTDQYQQIQHLALSGKQILEVYSKPGVYGWDKVDQGTELLLEKLPEILDKIPVKNNILDLGCGFGWIFLNLSNALPSHWQHAKLQITATDNNAAALLCAQKNAENCSYPTEVLASDAGQSIDKMFDLILCNPPFHQGFSHDKSLTEKFVAQTFKHLSSNGVAVFVVNQFIQLPLPFIGHTKKQSAIECVEYCREKGYKLLVLTRNGAQP